MSNFKNTPIPVQNSTQLKKLFDSYWEILLNARVEHPSRVQQDLMTWRRGSAQMVLRVNPTLGNVTIYSVLVSGVDPTEKLYRYLLAYNSLQRKECMGLAEKNGTFSVVMKYTLELELGLPSVIQRHVFQLQEIADDLDTELAEMFGGSLHYNDWNKMSQSDVDTLIGDLFG
ncbi:MAG: YbjN domain-containing protein [Deltaproteobacteria bacterium]|nr:YbjN domain-containing protein [Deltaproteobacteria bacterium]